MNDAEAADELTADNQRRIDALTAKGLRPDAAAGAVAYIAQGAQWEHLLGSIGGQELLDRVRLDIAGRVSRWLDDAERAWEKRRLTVVGDRG